MATPLAGVIEQLRKFETAIPGLKVPVEVAVQALDAGALQGFRLKAAAAAKLQAAKGRDISGFLPPVQGFSAPDAANRAPHPLPGVNGTLTRGILEQGFRQIRQRGQKVTARMGGEDSGAY